MSDKILKKTATTLGIFRYIIAATALFIPSHLQYQDVINESLYATSQLLDFTCSELQNDRGSSVSFLMYCTYLGNNVLSICEVLVEKLCRLYGNRDNELKLIMWVETVKASCRLWILVYHAFVSAPCHIQLLSSPSNPVIDNGSSLRSISKFKPVILISWCKQKLIISSNNNNNNDSDSDNKNALQPMTVSIDAYTADYYNALLRQYNNGLSGILRTPHDNNPIPENGSNKSVGPPMLPNRGRPITTPTSSVLRNTTTLLHASASCNRNGGEDEVKENPPRHHRHHRDTSIVTTPKTIATGLTPIPSSSSSSAMYVGKRSGLKLRTDNNAGVCSMHNNPLIIHDNQLNSNSSTITCEDNCNINLTDCNTTDSICDRTVIISDGTDANYQQYHLGNQQDPASVGRLDFTDGIHNTMTEDSIRRDCFITHKRLDTVPIGASETSSSGYLTPEMAILLGEIIYILRPVIYAATLRYMTILYSNNKSKTNVDQSDSNRRPSSSSSSTTNNNSASSKDESQNMLTIESSKPMLPYVIATGVSLIIEVWSINLTLYGLKSIQQRVKEFVTRGNTRTINANVKIRGITSTSAYALVEQEVMRRKFALFYYMIRSPIFDRITLPILNTISSYLQYIPVVRTIPDYLVNILKYLNNHHFYHSTSS